MRDLCEDNNLEVGGPTPLCIDSKSAIDLTYDPVTFKKTKHILRAANELRDRVARDIFSPTFVEGTSQLADMLTKPLGPSPHEAQRGRIMYETAPEEHEGAT